MWQDKKKIMRKIKIHILLIGFAVLNFGNTMPIDNTIHSGGTLNEICVTAEDPNFFRNHKGIFPKQVFEKVRVDSAIQWNDTILLACLINTESQTATSFEKMMIAQTVVDRANKNFGNFGSSIAHQIFAPAQFSGVVNRSNGFRWCYYLHPKKNRYNNPIVSDRFSYNPQNEKPVWIKRNGKKIKITFQDIAFENYEAARTVLLGERPFEKTILYFCNPKVSTDSKQVARVKRKAYSLPEKTKHIFAG